MKSKYVGLGILLASVLGNPSAIAGSDPFVNVMQCAASIRDFSIAAGYSGQVDVKSQKSHLIAFESDLAQCPGCKGASPKCFISSLTEMNGIPDPQIQQSCFPDASIASGKDVLALPFHDKSITLVYSPKANPRVWPIGASVNVSNGYVGPMPVPAGSIASLAGSPKNAPMISHLNNPTMRRAIEYKIMDSVVARSQVLQKAYPGKVSNEALHEANLISRCVDALRQDGIKTTALDSAADIAAKFNSGPGAKREATGGNAGLARP